jgi:hypothetical protein
VLEEDDAGQASGHGDLDILLHLAGGVLAVFGVDVPVNRGIDLQACPSHALPFAQKKKHVSKKTCF